jgi:hypothetical protein
MDFAADGDQRELFKIPANCGDPAAAYSTLTVPSMPGCTVQT